jgi:RNA polymerase sigma factor (sigma-70 family)
MASKKADSAAARAQSLPFAELVDGYHRGCPAASRALVDRYRHVLVSLARRVLARLRLHETGMIEDAVQETWLRIFTFLTRGGTFASEEEFVSYLRVTMRHCIFHYLRARKTAKRLASREEQLDPAKHDQAAPRADPAELTAMADELQHVLATFPPEFNAMFQMMREGESLREAAQKAGIKERTAHRWLHQLKELLAARRAQQER